VPGTNFRFIGGNEKLTASCFKAASFSQAKINRKKLSAINLRLKRRLLYGKCQAATGKVNLHLYHYAGNNPLKYTDPDGRTWDESTNQDFGEDYFKNGKKAWNNNNKGTAISNWMTGILEAVCDALNLAIVAQSGINPMAIMHGVGTITNRLAHYKMWPPNNGFLGGYTTQVVAKEGQILSRIGLTNGQFVSPPGTSMSQRGLPSSYPNNMETLWKVKKEFAMDAGIAAPWKDSVGGGLQYRLPDNIDNLVRDGYLEPYIGE
jgi:hypothetical protein